MKNMFLDPNKSLVTCTFSDCKNCVLNNQLQCHFKIWGLLRFFVVAFPPFILAGIGIAHINAWLLLPWVALALSYFGLIEIRVMCSHCPHYAEPEIKSLKCWANYGSPKLWKYNPGPMSIIEKVVFFIGLGLLGGYPMVILLHSRARLLFVLFILSIISMGGLMSRTMCNHCMNFACPFNRVEITLREAFFNLNPTIADTWKGAHQ
jgi:hypothetical protein